MISIGQLQQTLLTKYTPICFVDLAEITASPSAIYKQLQLCYQSEFKNNDRLVFYTSHSISDDLLKHLYQATDLIDISNFFILICGPEDLVEKAKSVATLYANDQTPFQTLQVHLDATDQLQDKFFIPETLCPLPWMHLEVSPKGEIRPCCVYSQAIGSVRNLSLTEAFSHSNLSALRQEFVEGKKPAGCRQCWELENNGLTSHRTYHKTLLKKQLLTDNFDQPRIISLDLKPGNTCNFKCRICNPMSSSLYAQETNKTRDIPIRSFNWAEENSTAIDEILTLLPDLKNIDMFGGEPFLIKPLLRLVKQAVDIGCANNIRLHYNSNGSIYPEHLIDYWKHFRNIDIQFSIDNIGNRFELERGGSWQEVDYNIKKLIGLNLPNVKISVMPAISIMNVLYLDELFDWANTLGLPVNPLYVDTPSEFSLKNLTAAAKQLILDKFQLHPWPEMKNILTTIATYKDTDGQEFVKLCKHFDSIRDQKFFKTHTEIATAMGYTG
jgi:MoaA/NifB/PqqE/SkfB family radical SAM enzyme